MDEWLHQCNNIDVITYPGYHDFVSKPLGDSKALTPNLANLKLLDILTITHLSIFSVTTLYTDVRPGPSALKCYLRTSYLRSIQLKRISVYRELLVSSLPQHNHHDWFPFCSTQPSKPSSDHKYPLRTELLEGERCTFTFIQLTNIDLALFIHFSN